MKTVAFADEGGNLLTSNLVNLLDIFQVTLNLTLKGSSSKPYQPPQAQKEQLNAVFTWSGKSYDPPINPNDQPNDSKTPVNFGSDDEDEESTP
ncbi:hypothetical protein Tco_1489830 [Tanacetum coccineum]